MRLIRVTHAAQADRYRALLVKQRDIMTALTGRLNERDETLLRLQEELEAYDLHQKCACLGNFATSHLAPAACRARPLCVHAMGCPANEGWSKLWQERVCAHACLFCNLGEGPPVATVHK